MTPLNPMDGGSTVQAPSASFSSSASANPAQSAGTVVDQLDRLEAEARALRQQAMHTQMSIQQLELAEPAAGYPKIEFGLPPNWGGQGLALGLCLALLASAMWWFWTRRTPTPAAVQNNDFVDSSYFPQEEPKWSSGMARRVSQGVYGREVQPPAPGRRQDGASHPAVVGRQIVSYLPDEVLDEVPNSQAQELFGAEEDTRSMGVSIRSEVFDPDIAASEVERVRKFLADKRADRSRQRVQDVDQAPSSTQGSVMAQLGEEIFAEYKKADRPDSVFGHLPQFKTLSPAPAEPPAEALGEDFAVAVLPPQTVPDLGAESRRVTLELWESGGHVMPSAPEFLLNLSDPDWALAMDDLDLGGDDPFELTAPDPETLENVRALTDGTAQKAPAEDVEGDDSAAQVQESDPAVQLELAHEFEALGLFQGARKLANEVLACGNAQLRSQAQTLLTQLDEHEFAKDQGMLSRMADQDDLLI